MGTLKQGPPAVESALGGESTSPYYRGWKRNLAPPYPRNCSISSGITLIPQTSSRGRRLYEPPDKNYIELLHRAAVNPKHSFIPPTPQRTTKKNARYSLRAPISWKRAFFRLCFMISKSLQASRNARCMSYRLGRCEPGNDRV